jgi:ribosome recycling factor
MNKFINAKQVEVNKTVEFFKKEISSLRTGRANPGILESVQPEVYGVRTPINGLASVAVQDGQCIVITPWDRSVIKDIEKAIVEADLGLGVGNEGDKIRLTVPRMTEENRKDLVKKLNERMEKAKISLRQIRDEIKNDIEKAESDKAIAEDDKFRFLKELEELINKTNDEIKTIREKKEEEIMTI